MLLIIQCADEAGHPRVCDKRKIEFLSKRIQKSHQEQDRMSDGLARRNVLYFAALAPAVGD